MNNQAQMAEQAASVETLIAHERQTWSMIQRRDLQGFASYLADDFYDIFPDGQERTKPELLEFLREAELKDYHLTNFRVTLLNSDAAIVTYDVDAHALIEGQVLTMKNAVTSGWARRDGRWLNLSAVAVARST